MPYRVEIGSNAHGQLVELAAAFGVSVEPKIQWVADNAAFMAQRRLFEMPGDLHHTLVGSFVPQQLVSRNALANPGQVNREFKQEKIESIIAERKQTRLDHFVNIDGLGIAVIHSVQKNDSLVT